MISPSSIKPLAARLLVKRYALPEKIGSIIVPEPWRKDGSRQVWELVAWGPRAEHTLGVRLSLPALVFSKIGTGVYLSDVGDGSEDYFMLAAEAVESVQPYEE